MSEMRHRMSPATLREFIAAFPHHSNAHLAEEFGSNVRAVEALGHRHKLTKTPECLTAIRAEVGRQFALDAAEAARRDAYILANHAAQTVNQIAEALGITADQVRHRANALGVKCKRDDRGGSIRKRVQSQQPVCRVSEPAQATTARREWFDARYQCHPAEQVPRVFSLVPVGVNPMTGRDWGVSL